MHHKKPRAGQRPKPLHLAWLGLALLLTPSLALAQEADPEEVVLVPPAARQGYFVSLGGQYSLHFNDHQDEDSLGLLPGSMGVLHVGEMLTERFGFGLRVHAGQASDDTWDSVFLGVLVDAQLVLFDHLALYVGAGVGSLRATDTSDDEAPLRAVGGGYYLAGVSYDFFPFHEQGESGGLAVTPSAQVMYLPGDSFHSTLVTFGLSFTWWSGLEKNMLELPHEEAYTHE